MKIASVKGFHDVLPDESARWAAIESRARQTFGVYSFREIRIPIVERTELFTRSIGEATDIVEKEMYTFADRDGTSLTLRPEGTASVVRAYVEHALNQQEAVSKLFYLGPMFRRERPQKGRLRQFSQIGAEVFGRADAAADAEMLALLYDLLDAIGIVGAEVSVNTLGCRNCRDPYRAALVEWGQAHHAEICADCQRRLTQNPLRLLDCKQPGCIAIRPSAPQMREHCCGPCREHFERVLALLAADGIEPRLNPYMVRGLDYYCRTAFEVVASGLGSQNAIGGGGRYDGLVRELGGADVPGVGFALGMERLAIVLAQGAENVIERAELVLLPVGLAAEAIAVPLARRLRREGARIEVESGEKSLKSQMRRADKSGARYALIIGEDEMAKQRLTVRDMQARRDHPTSVDLSCSLGELRNALAQL